MSTTTTKEPGRRRLTPEKRKAMILSTTAKLVSEEGVSALSMERIGHEAGVSKSLVYNYFPSLNDVLQATLLRELRVLRAKQAAAVDRATTFETMVREVTRVYIQYIAERGLIIERLQAEPSLTAHTNPTQYSRRLAVQRIAEIVAAQFGLDKGLAQVITDISFGLPAAAGTFLLNSDLSPEEIEDITVRMIIGSVTAAAQGHLVHDQPLRSGDNDLHY